MAEHRSIDEIMHGQDVQPGPDEYIDVASGELSTADAAGSDIADPPRTTDVAGTAAMTLPEEVRTPLPQAPSSTEDPAVQPAQGTEEGRNPLFATEPAGAFRSRWLDIQTSFVDEPRQAVEQADGLVAEVMRQLATTFGDERSRLEGQWDHGEDVSTEDLRLALRRYRTFFDRLLAI